jgi:hypothetical protein
VTGLAHTLLALAIVAITGIGICAALGFATLRRGVEGEAHFGVRSVTFRWRLGPNSGASSAPIEVTGKTEDSEGVDSPPSS